MFIALFSLAIEAAAVALAWMHHIAGLHTDEAKYLLNIPYPHPPLFRWLIGLNDGWRHQEIFWRIVFATLLLHAVWLIWDMGRMLPKRQRVALCGLWIFSSAVLLQAGSIGMAPITALQALLAIWLLSRPNLLARYPTLPAFLWLSMLFTAYQAVLFAPIIIVLLWRTRTSLLTKGIAFVAPMILLGLYTLINPLAVVAMGFAGTMSTQLPILDFLSRGIRAWLMAGSIVLSVMGVVGLLLGKGWEYILSAALVAAYVFVAYRPYYAILFPPILIAGLVSAPRLLKFGIPLLILQIMLGLFFTWTAPPQVISAARPVGQILRSHDVHGIVLINGAFGHDWQYEMPGRVQRYDTEFITRASAAVCLDVCKGIPRSWQKINETPEVWTVPQTP